MELVVPVSIVVFSLNLFFTFLSLSLNRNEIQSKALNTEGSLSIPVFRDTIYPIQPNPLIALCATLFSSGHLTTGLANLT